MTTGGNIHLFWIRLGSGGHVVGWNGRIYEPIAARSAHRPRRDLYHAALTVAHDGITWSIQMGPVWNVADASRGDGGKTDLILNA